MSWTRANGRKGQPGEPCTLAIFGVSGDLAKWKLFPALLNLRRSGLLGDEFAVIGLATSEMTSEAFRERVATDLGSFAPEHVDSGLWNWLAERTYYLPGNFRSPEVYSRLAEAASDAGARHATRGNVLHYLAPPDFFGDIVEELGRAGLVAESSDSFRRVIIEKPFWPQLRVGSRTECRSTAPVALSTTGPSADGEGHSRRQVVRP